MSNFDLLNTVLPEEGRYCVLGIGRYPDQKFYDTRAEVDQQVEALVKRGFDAYFGCAKFGPLNNRTHENVAYVRALWMDIDCGPTKAVPDEKGIIKGYVDQLTGLNEFGKFCKNVGLPKPILVSSGYGIHAYWLLEETVNRLEWEPLANRLRELCVEQGLIVDPSVFEASRVLRIPGTYNFKQEEPLEVRVLNENTPRMTYAQVKEILGAPDVEPVEEKPDFIPSSMSPLMESMMQNKIKRFKTIMLKSVQGEGCNQLLHCYENQATLDYNLWRSALSIATFCVDRDSAIHKMSANHPGYDRFKTEFKVDDLQRTGGPHHCATFEKQNPGGCADCKHKGKIKSPIMLGVEIEEADDEDYDVEVEAEDGEVETVRIPEYPFPFFRGKTGGIYRRPSEDEGDPELVYEHDLYIIKRLTDPDIGETLLFRLHLPMDGMKEFAIPLGVISSKEKLREALASKGVGLFAKQVDAMSTYVMTLVKNLQVMRKAEIMRTQFGWVDNDSKFILGDREITKDGVYYSPPSHITKSVAENLVEQGDFEKWKEVFNMYARPGLEPHAFAALTAFGSPLLKFTGMSGAIINVIHSSSGSGKSTALFMCNSVWGHPVKNASIWKDTFNAKMHRLGVMNNLPNTIDEITNTSPMEFSDLSYSISQGRGKNKMRGSVNEERVNLTSWQGITLTSSNASFYQKLGAAKDSPDGESMRLLEYEIKPNNLIDVAVGKQMFDHQLRENYGHAGEIYAQWLVNNLEAAKDLVRQIQAKLDKEVKFTQRERFWSAVAACNIAGGLIARNLGLHDYDMKLVYAWLVGMLGEMREDIRPPVSNPASTLGEFINGNMNHALVVNGENDARSNMVPMPTMEPKGELFIRYEPDTKHLWISAKAFKDFCVERQINYKDLLKELKEANVFKEAVNKRMAKGMKVVSPAVRALMFDTAQADFIHIDATDENRDSSL
jgi:ketosteroid isomerase-like protein